MARDYFAEMYVAGRFADAAWNVYFPHRDQGFDYIITRTHGAEVLVRPVQVKGLYPTVAKGDRLAYGYQGRLSLLHSEMVLVLVFFNAGDTDGTPSHIAYLPRERIRERSRGGFRCVPAALKQGAVTPRRHFIPYFDSPGLAAIEQPDWSGSRSRQSPSAENRKRSADELLRAVDRLAVRPNGPTDSVEAIRELREERLRGLSD